MKTLDKALEIGKTSATGSLHLFIGKIASTIILAIGTIILQGIILESDYGLYFLALIPATTFLIFQDWGVGTAIARHCAQFRAANKEADLRKIVIAGLTFEVTTGLFLTALAALTANYLASTIFGQPTSVILIIIASTTIFSTSIFVVTTNVFIGFERMKLLSLTLLCQAIAQGITAPLLVYFGYGALGAVIGYTLASVAASLVSVILLYFAVMKNLSKVPNNKLDITETLKPLLKYGVPLAIGTILGGLLTQFYSFMTALYVKDLILIGNYKVASNFLVLLGFFSVPITTVLFPAFSKLNPQKEPEIIKTVFASSVKYASLLIVPATMALIVLSNQIVGTLYGAKWSLAPPFMALSFATSLLTVFGSLSLGGLVLALGETRMMLKLNVITLASGVPLAYLLIPSLGITGVILGLLLAGVPSLFVGLYLIWRRYGTKIDYPASARILLASVIATAVIYLFLSVLTAPYWIELGVGLILFMFIYLICSPLIGAVNQTDLNSLRAMFSELGFFSKIIEIPLIIMEKPLKIRRSHTAINDH